MKRETIQKCSTIYMLVLLLAFGTGTVAVYGNLTLTAWWKPALLGALPAAAVSGWVWRATRWLTGLRNYALCYVLTLALTTLVMDGTLLTVNYYSCDEASHHEVKATVVEKRVKVRHRVRRLARHVTTRGEKYTVYELVLDVPGYGLTEMRVPTDLYNRSRTGGYVVLDVARGNLGFDVVKDKRTGPKPRPAQRLRLTPEMRRVLMPADD